MNITKLENDGRQWFEISGTDTGTDWEFEGDEIFGLAIDDVILDCDGYPLTTGDRQEIAVRNAIESVKWLA